MKHKILITALIAIGFSLSGASHALSVLKPDGTRSVANIEGNKLMLRDATGKLWLLASGGTYQTDDGRTIYVKGGVIWSMFASGGRPRTYAPSRFAVPIDNKGKAGIVGSMDNEAKAGVIAPMNQGPDKLLPAVQPSAPGMGSPPRIPERITSDLKRLPGAQGRHLPPPPGGCPDPAIRLQIITGATDNIRLAVNITNKGSVPFISKSTQQAVTFSHGERVLISLPWGVWHIPPGANIFINHTVRWDRASEFPVGFTAEIAYDPDIFIDGNPQNDDCVMSNNKSSVTVDEVRRQFPDGGR